MKKIAEAGNLVLYETSKGRGFVENTDTKVKTPEKEIISLISMSDEWVAISGVEKEDESVRRYRDELAELEDETGISVGEASVVKGDLPPEPKKDEPPPSKEGEPETYGKDETP